MKQVIRVASLTVVLVLIAAILILTQGQRGAAQTNESLAASAATFRGVLTYHNDNQRTGHNLAETILTQSNVRVGTFGKLFTLSTDGRVDAQPLYVPNLTINGGTHNTLFVATEHGSLYAFDADQGLLLWRITTLKSGEVPSDDRGCGQITPEIGITATPVIDPAAGTHGIIYLVAMSKTSAGVFHQRLHALDLSTGAEQFGGPVEITATYPGTGDNSSNGSVIFDPKQYKSRPGLVLVRHMIYTFWSSHCDYRPYTGWIISYNQNTLKQQSIWNVTPNGNAASIWAAGAAPAADSLGNLYFLTGNGTFDTTLTAGGFPNRNDYGNAFMKMSTKSNKLSVADYFTMSNTVDESNTDLDLGSGGVVVLPNIKDGNGVIHHLAVGAGKDTKIYIVDRDNMGKFSANDAQIYQEVSGALSGGLFSAPAYYNSRLYLGAVADRIKAFGFGTNGKLIATPKSQTSTVFGYPGATPTISAGSGNPGILWAAENTSPAVLHAYSAQNLSVELYNSNQAANGRDHFGAGNKYIVPTVANGKVYVGTTNGVGVFGLLP